MKPENAPISDDEWLLRRVRIERFRTEKIPVISPNAFEPRTKGRDVDIEGISLYRAACLSSPTEILKLIDVDRQHEVGIVRIPVLILKELGLSVQIRIDSRILGNVVIPELNAHDYEADKARFTSIKALLASVASEAGNILIIPRL